MQKDGDWIAMLSGELEVTRVDVRANELLDLVEVLEVDRVTERPTRVRFLDRVEGARLLKRLSVALDGLEAAAILGDHPRYAASSRQTGIPRIWSVVDLETIQFAPKRPSGVASVPRPRRKSSRRA